MHRFLLLLVPIVAALSEACGQPTRHPVAGATGNLDAYVARTLRTFGVPGMAVSIVRNGKVISARGYGVRHIGDTATVTPQTRFGIGEISRAFTATAITILADMGTLPLDTPVVRHLREFALADPYVTANITTRDLLLQRSGLGTDAGDLLWWPSTTYSRTDIVRRLREVPLRTGFRSGYSHDNVLYIVAGALIEAVTHKSWEQVITDTLLRRLDMRHTGVRHSDAMLVGDVAAPHALVNGTTSAIRPLRADAANPNSGINSSAEDMAKWMLAQLNGGRNADSVAVWSKWAQLQLWRGTTPMRAVEPHDLEDLRRLNLPEAYNEVLPRFRMYALGAEVRDYRGTRIIMQQGSLQGYASELVYVPSLDLGITVLTNRQNQEAVNAVIWRLLDEHLGAGRTDWVGILDGAAKLMRRQLVDLRKQMPETMLQLDSALRDTTSKPSLPIWNYAGRYEDPWYGAATIEISKDGQLTLLMGATPGMVGDIVHFEKDVFTVRWRDRTLNADAYLWFSFNRRGEIESARLEPMDRDVVPSYDYADLRLRRRSF